ncbi:hypothetical protein [Alkalihalobacterium elongatum]|uniref:hypothetical protein n=1 Tax=Alkalihalobacterium elongatum TaxID=2675466 RepID=UPI001C1F359D|nr:hypothetical protein [Alkalihalobacterium elongatum]
MKKTITLLLGIVVVIFAGLYLNQKLNTVYGEWAINWGFEIPKPTEVKTVFESPHSPRGEGEAYYIINYDDKQFEKVRIEDFWKPINNDHSLNLVTKYISDFQGNVLDLYFENQVHYSNLFSTNQIEYKKGDYYFYKLRDDGSFFISVLSIENQLILLWNGFNK